MHHPPSTHTLHTHTSTPTPHTLTRTPLPCPHHTPTYCTPHTRTPHLPLPTAPIHLPHLLPSSCPFWWGCLEDMAVLVWLLVGSGCMDDIGTVPTAPTAFPTPFADMLYTTVPHHAGPPRLFLARQHHRARSTTCTKWRRASSALLEPSRYHASCATRHHARLLGAAGRMDIPLPTLSSTRFRCLRQCCGSSLPSSARRYRTLHFRGSDCAQHWQTRHALRNSSCLRIAPAPSTRAAIVPSLYLAPSWFGGLSFSPPTLGTYL